MPILVLFCDNTAIAYLTRNVEMQIEQRYKHITIGGLNQLSQLAS